MEKQKTNLMGYLSNIVPGEYGDLGVTPSERRDGISEEFVVKNTRHNERFAQRIENGIADYLVKEAKSTEVEGRLEVDRVFFPRTRRAKQEMYFISVSVLR
jgi:hypothetical protein